LDEAGIAKNAKYRKVREDSLWALCLWPSLGRGHKGHNACTKDTKDFLAFLFFVYFVVLCGLCDLTRK